jgi:hypothetical protein
MSSFYDDSSLVVIPSGYKTSKVYAEKPTDGSGDLAFTRTGDTATRVNSTGLIEKVRTNLVTYSNSFSNAAWTKVGGTTLTAGQTDYLGGTNAWKWEATGAATIQLAQNPAGSAIRTASIYAKAGNVSTISLWVGSAVTFNLSTGNVTSGTGVITSVGNGWYRCSAFGTGISHNPYFTSASAGDYVLISFAQLEEGDIATAYIPTTTAAVSVGPVANVPRLDYLGSSCPRLLLEPQRSNLITFSEQFNQWTASSATVTANYAVSPDGYTNADRVVFAAGGLLYNGATGSAGQNTLSVYAKATNGVSGQFRFFGNGNTTLSTNQTATGEWQRFTFTYTYSAVTAGLAAPTTGGGVSDVIFWGMQHEVGAYATSYIPTPGASSVTRVADAASKTGISSLIGQTEGVLFVDFTVDTISAQTNDPVLCYMKDGGVGERYVQLYSTGNLRYLENNGAAIATITKTGLSVGRHKCAIAYANNDMVFYVDGVQIGTDTSGTPSGFSTFALQYYNTAYLGQQKVNQALVFKTRLTNAQLAELTTL